MSNELTAVIMTLALMSGLLIGMVIGYYMARKKGCAHVVAVSRCEAYADPRCAGGNCTKHCLAQCKCVEIHMEDARDRRAALDLSFLERTEEGKK